MYQIDLENGKYTFINNNGVVSINRFREEWRNESGDKALLCLLQHVEKLEEENRQLKENQQLPAMPLNLTEGKVGQSRRNDDQLLQLRGRPTTPEEVKQYTDEVLKSTNPYIGLR